MATFAQLKEIISQKISKADNSTYLQAQIPVAINSAISYLNRKYPTYFAESAATITLTVNDGTVPNVPTDFLYPINDYGMIIEYSTSRYFLRKVDMYSYQAFNTNSVGLPYLYTMFNTGLSVYPLPDQTYTLILRYIKNYPDLVNDSDSNDWTTTGQRMLEAQVLADIYHDQRNSAEFYQNYIAKVGIEYESLQVINNSRRATGRAVSDGIYDDNDYNYSGSYL